MTDRQTNGRTDRLRDILIANVALNYVARPMNSSRSLRCVVATRCIRLACVWSLMNDIIIVRLCHWDCSVSWAAEVEDSQAPTFENSYRWVASPYVPSLHFLLLFPPFFLLLPHSLSFPSMAGGSVKTFKLPLWGWAEPCRQTMFGAFCADKKCWVTAVF